MLINTPRKIFFTHLELQKRAARTLASLKNMYILDTIYFTENSLKISQSISQSIIFIFIHVTSSELQIIEIKYHRKVGERASPPTTKSALNLFALKICGKKRCKT